MHDLASAKPATIDQLFSSENAFIRETLFKDPKFAPFRFVSDALLTFIFSEKNRLALNEETRIVKDTTGFVHLYNAKDDCYHPKYFEPFDLIGLWIPSSEGNFFSIREESEQTPLIRKGPQDEKEILFLIHPKSVTLFEDLIQKYAHTQVAIPALSLSSFRTLLIAIPKTTSLPQYAFVKVSLDENIGGTRRILSLKECAGSVATAAVVSSQSGNIAFMKEDFSFVINNAGMIHRPIPECLLDPDSKLKVIPFFSLFGVKNRELLDLLIRQSCKGPTEFVVDCLIKPIARVVVDMLYIKHKSLEIHGQNLLLMLNTNASGQLDIHLMYRKRQI